MDIFNYLEYQVRENPKYQELEKQRMEVWKFEKYLTNFKCKYMPNIKPSYQILRYYSRHESHTTTEFS